MAEHAGGKLSPSTLSTITAATQLQQGGITVLVAGKGVEPVAKQAQEVPGVSKVLVADDAVRCVWVWGFGTGIADRLVVGCHVIDRSVVGLDLRA